jgi:general stress protein 26
VADQHNGHTLNYQESIEKLRDLIKDIDFAMLTTVDDNDGTLRSRPMSTQDVEFDGQLWFFIYDDSAKVDEIQQQRQVNVSYADPANQTYISVSGTADVVHDRAKMQQFWKPELKIYFPDGLETPNIALLRVDVQKAEYWQSDGKVASILQIAKALVTGSEYEGGKNEKINLR